MNIKSISQVSTATGSAGFWDISGIVPLCCLQPSSFQARQASRVYSQQVVWWGTSVEAISSFNRLIREGAFSSQESQQAFSRPAYLRKRWDVIPPEISIRDAAETLLGAHKLRAADALQLAAALFWCRNFPRGKHFISGDGDLLDAAAAESSDCDEAVIWETNRH